VTCPQTRGDDSHTLPASQRQVVQGVPSSHDFVGIWGITQPIAGFASASSWQPFLAVQSSGRSPGTGPPDRSRSAYRRSRRHRLCRQVWRALALTIRRIAGDDLAGLVRTPDVIAPVDPAGTQAAIIVDLVAVVAFLSGSRMPLPQTSSRQVGEHPSPGMRLPSSHSSPGSRMPLPQAQIGKCLSSHHQKPGCRRHIALPIKNAVATNFFWHLAEHPSPGL